MPKAESPAGQQRYVKVIKTEEKGSDVNLATYLLRDAYSGSAEAVSWRPNSGTPMGKSPNRRAGSSHAS